MRGSESLLLPFIPVPNSVGGRSFCLTKKRNRWMPKWSVAFCLFEKQTLFVLARLVLSCFTSNLGKENIVWQTPS